jgi:hypothetical protein
LVDLNLGSPIQEKGLHGTKPPRGGFADVCHRDEEDALEIFQTSVAILIQRRAFFNPIILIPKVAT